MLRRLAEESGIETPTADDLIRMDKKRKGKKLSNEDWESPTDPDARIAKMKDGRTRLGYKPEHAIDLDTGAIVAAPVHEADQGDTSSLPGTLEAAAQNLESVGKEPSPEDSAELVADKGYHSRGVLKDQSPTRTGFGFKSEMMVLPDSSRLGTRIHRNDIFCLGRIGLS